MRRSSLHRPGVGLSIAAGLACAPAAPAIDRAWLLPLSGSWITSAAWAPLGFPNNGDTATIDIATVVPYTVSLANGVTISSLTVNQALATLQVNPGAGLAMGSGPISVSAGTFSMGSASLTGTGTFTVSPGATLSLSACTMPSGMTYALNGNVTVRNTVQGFTTAGYTNNGAMTLTGAGLAWLFSPPLTNNGTITANGVGGGTARLQARITNSATGVINLLTNTETFTSPQSNSGSYSLASGKTLTIGSFATVNQNAGTMTLSGAYSHLNGTFNMNGGALSIPAGGSMLKDGGNFVYNNGAITGEPTLHNVFVTLNPGASGAPTFRIHGTGNGLSGEVPAYATLNVEATPTEAALTGAFGGFVNRGVINLIGDEVNVAAIGFGGGTLVNRGVITARAPSAALADAGGGGGGLDILGLLISHAIENEEQGVVASDLRTRLTLDFANGRHTNKGTVSTAAASRVEAPGSIVITDGSDATFAQEAGAIHNDGEFIVEEGCAFEFNGGECTGNPIELDGATLTFGHGATGACSFDLVGVNNVCFVDAFGSGQSMLVSAGPLSDGETAWSNATDPGEPTQINGGHVFLAPYLSFNSILDLADGLDVGAGGELSVGASGGSGMGVILGASTDLIQIDGTIGDPAALNCFGPIDIQLGVSVGAGSVAGTVWWSGFLAQRAAQGVDADPSRGAPASGLIQIGGAYTQGAQGALRLGVAGLAPGSQHDTLAIAGHASLGGRLDLALAGGFQPVWNSFTLLTYATRTGDFATFNAPVLADPSLRWWRSAGPTSCVVGVRNIADVNHDGTVDFFDLNILLTHFGKSAPPGSAAAAGDANGDGQVDFFDLNDVLNFFNHSAE